MSAVGINIKSMQFHLPCTVYYLVSSHVCFIIGAVSYDEFVLFVVLVFVFLPIQVAGVKMSNLIIQILSLVSGINI